VPQNAPDASPCDLGVSPCDLGAQNSLCTKILIFGLYGGASFRPLAWMPLALQNHPFNTSHLGDWCFSFSAGFVPEKPDQFRSLTRTTFQKMAFDTSHLEHRTG
jgi:hypothetical protein